jgi:FixJ family two-component response regulator
MKTNQLESQSALLGRNERKPSRKLNERRHGAQTAVAKGPILLITQDAHLHNGLRGLANTTGMLVVRLDAMLGVVPAMRAISPAIVLLDLDLPNQAAWDIADAILQQQNCPPVVLLSSCCEQFDVNTAIRAGSIVDKSEGAARLLDIAHEALSMPLSNRAERNAILRVLIRWLKPCSWLLPSTPAYRFWGINE